MKILSEGADLFHADGQKDKRLDRQTDRQTDTTKLIVDLRNFANAPNNLSEQSVSKPKMTVEYPY
jgi:hypothetical protein